MTSQKRAEAIWMLSGLGLGRLTYDEGEALKAAIAAAIEEAVAEELESSLAARTVLAAGLARIDSLTCQWKSNNLGGAVLHRARWIRLGEIARLVLREAGGEE